MKKKKNLLVSFSGGETSAYMAHYLWNNFQSEYNMVFVFANTGDEEEETYKFIHRFEQSFNIKIHWIEAKVNEQGVSSSYIEKDYYNASRDREPFENVIAKYGIPNQNFPHCNREMKLNPIHSFCKYYFKGEDYYTAIGIRYDEIDRISKHRKKNKIIYPLIEFNQMTKAHVSAWWDNQEFRLNLKSYQTNCRTCWKKSYAVLAQIYKENPNYFEFNQRMEEMYGEDKYVFFRGGLSTIDLIELLKNINSPVMDKHKVINYQLSMFETESCDIYTNCSDN